MTTKAAFTEQEWDLVRGAPPTAGLLVITASHGGMMRETFEMAKVYAEARQVHGESEFLDELVSSKPKAEKPSVHSADELKAHTVQLLGEAVAKVGEKATPAELEDYRAFILTLTERVAKRHKEDGVDISEAEQAAIDDVRAAIGGAAA
ncbi:MAG: hypothetical protein JHC95_12310 [Solirubrobacteraceae bacterium]|nr:hypothetical protein [Solirubrobacteraceae bacterium]